MRLVKLSVQRFQCIESAEVEFGPGLNVLYGPNDLGKSSLVWALRAVLLLQHNSAHHEQFVTWHGGGEPSVALTFSDAENRYWRVTKVRAEVVDNARRLFHCNLQRKRPRVVKPGPRLLKPGWLVRAAVR